MTTIKNIYYKRCYFVKLVALINHLFSPFNHFIKSLKILFKDYSTFVRVEMIQYSALLMFLRILISINHEIDQVSPPLKVRILPRVFR